jgi:GrpB-like predicted nucleotidyltransferase (UPF0157 family)
MPQSVATTIAIVDYDPRWPMLFEEERVRIAEALGDLAADIQHVGSTSVPGLAAKPIVDIGIALGSLVDAVKCITPLFQLGYECLGEYGIAERIYFRKRTDNPVVGQSFGGISRSHQIHMYEVSHSEWEAHILFRDYLRTHPDTAGAYETLKRRLASQFDNVDEYAIAKTDFVREVLIVCGFDVSRKQWEDG